MKKAGSAPSPRVRAIFLSLREDLKAGFSRAEENISWLERSLHPYFFITMGDEREALLGLATGLHTLGRRKQIVLAEERNHVIVASLSTPGSFYESLRRHDDRGLSYAELTHSTDVVPGTRLPLEMQRLEFRAPASGSDSPPAPGEREQVVKREMSRLYPADGLEGFEEDFALLSRSNGRYVAISPPERIARILWLCRRGRAHNGLYFDVEQSRDFKSHRETRILFAVGNPPLRGFLPQTMEVLHRLDLGVRRAYCLLMETGEGPYFLGTFYVRKRGGRGLREGRPLFERLKAELYNTQILSSTSRPYSRFVTGGLMSGEEASLVNAFISFCFTTLAQGDPDRFGHQEVARAFTSNPEASQLLCRLFRLRFDPRRRGAGKAFAREMKGAVRRIEAYNTGHRHLDGVRKAVYRTALLFIRSVLKTNFFVPEKHALAFRLDPAYLKELGGEFTAGLPAGAPFRITFLSGRHGAGYHIGFADISRGGWRTVLCGDEDDYNETLETLFREAFVLAHTQHLKNKDIYEGGAKLVVALDVSDARPGDVRHRLHSLQYGFANALFDIFALQGGLRCHPLVVDYLGDEEAIELGPDENMDDDMIELIARQAVKRGYILGRGVISSKRAGIGHRRWGVTSLGVVSFAAAALRELGTDIGRDAFTVKMTGGPRGDVAGNTMRILLERCPRVRFTLIADGSGALFDPGGIDRRELRRMLLADDIDAFPAERIGPGGFLLSRRRRRRKGMRDMHLRLRRHAGGVREEWVTADDMHEQFDELPFSAEADLFIPAGGRPETVHEGNWERFFPGGRAATCRAVVEGANSFFSPAARRALQERGVLVFRDSSANKCGVIASSYEIVSNLLMSDEEFLACEERYVADVLAILERKASDEAALILRRRRESGGTLLGTDISESLSGEINALHDRLFDLFTSKPSILRRPSFRRALLAYLPECVTRRPGLRRRVARLPLKYRCAMAASEIAGSIVYGGGWHADFEQSLGSWVKARFAGGEGGKGP